MLCDILTPQLVRCQQAGSSRKRAIEDIAGIVSSHIDIPKLKLFKQLIAREELGSTALGNGVAIPHCRLQGLDKITGCLVTLDKGVDFEAPDNKNVDILFALLVPEHEIDAHLDILAKLAGIFSKPQTLLELRQATTSSELLEVLQYHAKAVMLP